MKRKLVCPGPICTLVLVENGGALVGAHFGETPETAPLPLEPSPLLLEGQRQLEQYFSGQRREFQLPLSFRGTAFQERVWRAIASIPYGQVLSYRDLAQAAGSPRAFRAAGTATGANPLAVIIPCHRVVASDGSLGGFGGGLKVKRALLELERRTVAAQTAGL